MTNDIDELICLIRKFTKSCTIAKYICVCGFWQWSQSLDDNTNDNIWTGPWPSIPKANNDDDEFNGKIILSAKRLLD